MPLRSLVIKKRKVSDSKSAFGVIMGLLCELGKLCILL